MSEQSFIHANYLNSYNVLTGQNYYLTQQKVHNLSKEREKWLTNEVTSLFNSQGQQCKII